MATITGNASEFITFTRASNATVTDSDGKIKWAPHNLLLASEQFDSASWQATSMSAFGSGSVANATAAPNGTTTADLRVPANASSTHTIWQTAASSVNGVPYTTVLFVKPYGYTKLALVENELTGYYVSYDATGSGTVLTESNATGTITPLSDGWYRITHVSVAGGTSYRPQIFFLPASYTTGTYTSSWTANGTSGMYLWGAHLYRSDLGGMKANTSAYPMYNPTTPKNLLGYTEDFSNAAWAVATGTATKTSNTDIAPNGLQTADTLAATSANTTIWQTYVPVVDGKYMASIYLKRKAGSGTVQITADGSSFTTVALTSSWERFNLAYTGVAGTKAVGVKIVTSGDEVYAWGAQLSDSASLDTYVPNYGAAPTAAAYYGPRLDFDGSTLAAKGLLVEELRTNSLLQSAAFDQSPWTSQAFNAGSVAPTVTANTAIAPDGTQTADTISFGSVSSGSINRRIQTSSQASGTNTFTGTVWLKLPSGTATVYLWLDDGTSGSSVGETLVSLTTTWRRFSITATVSPSQPGNMRFSIAQKDGSTLTAFDLHAWGAQLELGTFATSYIPTTGAATATRNADVASVSTQAFPYNQAEGSVVVNATLGNTSTNGPVALTINDGTGNNEIYILQTVGTGTRRSVLIYAGGVPQATLAESLTNTVGLTTKVAGAFKLNDVAGSIDGGTVLTYTPATIPTVNTMRIGNVAAGTQAFNGHIRQITYLPRRISNTELQTRTS
jgi:hypothetical protein